MKRMLLVLALAGLLVMPASAGGPVSLGTSWTGGGQHSSWIEQQQTSPTTPTNPFGGSCFWSVNDHEFLESRGYLDPGVSISLSKCVVAGFQSNVAPFGFSTAEVVTRSPSLMLTVCYEPQGRCFSANPVLGPDRLYHSTFCGRALYHESDPAVIEISDSFGGRGVVTSVTTTISNPTGKRVRDAIARVGLASDIAVFLHWPDAVGCLPEIPYVDRFEYPFEWASS